MFILEADRELSGLIYLVFDLGIFGRSKLEGSSAKEAQRKENRLGKDIDAVVVANVETMASEEDKGVYCRCWKADE